MHKIWVLEDEMSVFSSQLEINCLNKVLIHKGFGYNPTPLEDDESRDQHCNRKNSDFKNVLPARHGLKRITSSHEGFNLKFFAP